MSETKISTKPVAYGECHQDGEIVDIVLTSEKENTGDYRFAYLERFTEPLYRRSQFEAVMAEEKLRMQPLRNVDGGLRLFFKQVDGKSFYCKCGCNIFHKPDVSNLELYKCNKCGELCK